MSIKGKQVRLGIEADKSTIVHREEIYQKIKQENLQATRSSTNSASQAHELLKNSSSFTDDNDKETAKKIIIRKKDTAE